MSDACRECGNDLFVGEARCPRCGARAPEPAADPDAPGWLDARPPGPVPPAPPPEGIDLIIQKHRADQEMLRPPPSFEDDFHANGPFPGAGYVYGREVDLGEMVKPTRDRDGNIEWDLKYAIVGAIVVAVFVGLVAAYVFGAIGSGGSQVSRLGR